MKRITYLLLLVLILAAGFGIGWYQLMPGGKSTDLRLAEPEGGDFTLQSAKGPISLADYRGKVTVLYFGYTYCPDICPTSLSLLTQALNALQKHEIDKVQTLFISVDPERDTPAQLDRFTRYFHENIIGVTGDSELVKQVATAYGAAYRRVDGESKGGYLVDHTSVTYVIDPEGKLRESLPHGSDPVKILSAIRAYLPASGGS